MINHEKNPMFDDLFERAIAEWPPEIPVDSIEFHDDARARFSTYALYEMSEAISHKYLRLENEVIMRNLHDSIYAMLHDMSRLCTRLRPAELRRSEVRIDFEKALRCTAPSEGWSSQAMGLIDDYFSKSQSRSE